MKNSNGIRRRTFLASVGGTFVAAQAPGLISRAAAADLKGTGEVIVYDGGGAWGAAQKAAFFGPFEAETGIKVVPNAGAPATKILAGIKAGAPGYDVFDISGARVATFAKEALLHPVDYKWFDPADKAAYAPVPAGTHAVPLYYYAVVLAYDPKKFSGSPPRSWADVWSVDRFPGKRAFAPGAWGPSGATFEVALLADGVPPEKLYPLDWERAQKSLDRLRPSILKFWQSGAESVQLVVDGQIVVGSTWNGRVTDLQAQGASIDMSWENAILEQANLVVPKGAKNVENAMKYLAFTSRPAVQAKFAEMIAYGPANKRAYDLIKPERAAILPTSPKLPKLVTQDYAWWNEEAAGGGRTNEQLAPMIWERWISRA